MPTYTDFNPYLDIPAGAARTTARTTVPGSDPVTIPGSSPQPSIDYELQDYFDDTGVPVRYLFFIFCWVTRARRVDRRHFVLVVCTFSLAAGSPHIGYHFTALAQSLLHPEIRPTILLLPNQ
jgi:hypothetical protein